MEQSIENKLLKANEAFKNWKNVSFADRQKLIAKAAEIFKNKSEEFGKIITKEMNKPISQAISEVEKCALMMNYYAEAENVLKPKKSVQNILFQKYTMFRKESFLV